MHFPTVHIAFCIRFECDNDDLAFDLFELVEKSNCSKTNPKMSRAIRNGGNYSHRETHHRWFAKAHARNGWQNEAEKDYINIYLWAMLFTLVSQINLCFFVQFFYCCKLFLSSITFVMEFPILWLKFIYEAVNGSCYRCINHILLAFSG